MPPVRTVYVPRFGSQLGSSQRDEPDQTTNQTTEPPFRCRRDKGGNKRAEKTGFFLKVKLPKHNNTLSKTVTKEDKTPRRLLVEPAANTTKTTGGRGGTGPDSDPVDRDVFFFSQQPTSIAVNEKEKAKHAVLRTISKMLEENQLIRERMVPISQANRGCIY